MGLFCLILAPYSDKNPSNKPEDRKVAISLFSVQLFLEESTKDPELEKQVGMLWLGSEFAQLNKDYCTNWTNSRAAKPCNAEAINRSAFVSWVDCRL